MAVSDWAKKARYFKAFDRRRDYAILCNRTCDVYQCSKLPIRYIGSHRLGWLYFCSLYKAECEAINRYLSNHERAKFPSGPSWKEFKRTALAAKEQL